MIIVYWVLGSLLFVIFLIVFVAWLPDKLNPPEPRPPEIVIGAPKHLPLPRKPRENEYW